MVFLISCHYALTFWHATNNDCMPSQMGPVSLSYCKIIQKITSTLRIFITTKFCTCPNSCAVGACVKFCGDQTNKIRVIINTNFNQVWNFKSWVLCATGSGSWMLFLMKAIPFSNNQHYIHFLKVQSDFDVYKLARVPMEASWTSQQAVVMKKIYCQEQHDFHKDNVFGKKHYFNHRARWI